MAIKLLLLSLFFSFTSLYTTPDSSQVLTTKLQVTVRDELGNLVDGAEVKLFKTEEDYTKEQNQVGKTLKTDAKGKASFNELDAIEYYIIVEKGDLDNSGAGTKTGSLTPKRVNKVTIIIS